MNFAPQRSLCVFDLDETLVHSSLLPFDGSTPVRVGQLLVHTKLRSHARELLLTTAKRCDVALWSAGQEVYVCAIVERFFADVPFQFVWAYDKCTKWRQVIIVPDPAPSELHGDTPTVIVDERCTDELLIKPLFLIESEFGYPMDRIAMIDDWSVTALYNERNLIEVWPFETDDESRVAKDDSCLLLLAFYLSRLFERCEDGEIGHVDKRFWASECVALLRCTEPATIEKTED